MSELARRSRGLIREARPSDFAAIAALLRNANLPLAGVKENLGHFILLVDDEKLLGVAGLEIYGDKGLLRSVAVRDGSRGMGHGKLLCSAILGKAKKQRLTEIYLLTETAEGFFLSLGFKKIERRLVDAQVQASEEFQSLCPSTATCLHLLL